MSFAAAAHMALPQEMRKILEELKEASSTDLIANFKAAPVQKSCLCLGA